MARPLRFRHSPGHWTDTRVTTDLFQPLDENIGATASNPWYREPTDYHATRFDMDNGDVALFCWNSDDAYWIGNTETPAALWNTEKYTFAETPTQVSQWAEREFLAILLDQAPWLEHFPHVSWFFLPVFCSKDGRHTSREFFREHAAGFPDATASNTLDFYEEFLATGVLDEYRYVMASKLGTSTVLDVGRMSSTMAEFNAANLLTTAGYSVIPEVEVTTGHSIDFRVDPPGVLVEVTRPSPPNHRNASSPVRAIKETAGTKTTGQLESHAGGVVLFVDCSSFPAADWTEIQSNQPEFGHRPALVYRMHPNKPIDGYTIGSIPFDIPVTFSK